jgi:hypothetical protein
MFTSYPIYEPPDRMPENHPAAARIFAEGLAKLSPWVCARCGRADQPHGNGLSAPPDQQICADCAVELGRDLKQQVIDRLIGS